MQKLIASLFFLLFLTIPAICQNIKVAGIASKGGKIVRTSAQVQHTLMETYPSATVTVYLTGTLTLASIFSDEVGTVKANPFAANSDASWFFYVAAGRYDIKFSGTGIIVPFTLSDVFVDAGGGGGGSGVDSFNGRTGVVVPTLNDYLYNMLNFAGSNFNSIEIRSASDLSSGTLPDARFPATLPSVSGTNLTNLNATNITSGTLNDARLSVNVPLKNTANTFSLNNIFTANVGINTSTPDRRLEVLDGSNPQLRLSAVDSSTFADLYVDSGGTLNILPSGNVTFDSVGNQVNPLNNFDQNLGQINKKWLSLHAAELFVETLVAQNTIATIGGRIIVAPSNILIADLPLAATTINVKYNNLNNGDRIYMEGNNSVEFMAVTSGPSVISGGFSYTVTRNLDGTGANDWFAGDAMVNTGVSGNGFIDLYSLRGVKSSTQTGPTIVGNVRNSSTFNDWTENWAIGNLNGLYGYGASNIHGIALGKYASTDSHITIESTNGIRFFDGLSTVASSWHPVNGITLGNPGAGIGNVRIGSNTVIIRTGLTERIKLNGDGSGFVANNLVSWDAAGTFSVTGNAVIGGVTIGSGKMFVGTGTFNNSNTGFYVDSAGQFSLKDKLSWNGTTLTINGDIIAGNTIIDDVDGISLTTVTSGGKGATTNSSKIRWITSGAVNVGEIVGHRAGTTQLNIIEIWGRGPQRGEVLLTASSEETEVSGETAYFRVKAEGPDSRSFMSFSGGSNFKGISIGVAGSPTISGTGPSLEIWSDTIRLREPRTPASASATCNQGEISWDTGFIYVCTATNTWKRSAIATW